MSNRFLFELASPEKLILSKKAKMAIVPGGSGLYGVLAGHAPMITTLDAGVVEVYEESETVPSDRVFVVGGFAETTATRCTVLAEKAIPVSQITRAHAENELKELEGAFIEAETEEGRDALEHHLHAARLKLQAVA